MPSALLNAKEAEAYLFDMKFVNWRGSIKVEPMPSPVLVAMGSYPLPEIANQTSDLLLPKSLDDLEQVI